MEEATLRTIQQETERFFGALGPFSEVQVREQEGTGVVIEVRMEDPQLFIGERGQTLGEIQHLLRAVIKKKAGEWIPLSLDINNYRKNREHHLRELARTTADEVSLLKQERELPSMGAAERRIVHTELAERQDVVSESRGEEPARRVVIRPKAKTAEG